MKNFAFALFLFAAHSAFSASGWSPYLTVNSVHVESNSGLIVISTSGGSSYNGCLANKWIVTGTSETLQNRVYTLLLTAVTTGNKIQLWYTDNCNSWNYHSVTAALIEK